MPVNDNTDIPIGSTMPTFEYLKRMKHNIISIIGVMTKLLL